RPRSWVFPKPPKPNWNWPPDRPAPVFLTGVRLRRAPFFSLGRNNMRRLGFCLVTFLLPLGLSAPVLALEPTILTANGGPKPEEYEGVGQPVVPPLLAQNGRLYGLDHFHNVFSLNDYPGHSWELVDLTDLGLKIVSGPLVQDTRKDRGSLYVAGFRAESLFDELDTGRLVRLDADGTHPE